MLFRGCLVGVYLVFMFMIGYAALRASVQSDGRCKVLWKSTLGGSDKLQVYVDWLWNTDRKSNQTLTCVSKAASSSREMGPVKVSSSFIIATVTVTLVQHKCALHLHSAFFDEKKQTFTGKRGKAQDDEQTLTFTAELIWHQLLSPEGSSGFSARTKGNFFAER